MPGGFGLPPAGTRDAGSGVEATPGNWALVTTGLTAMMVESF